MPGPHEMVPTKPGRIFLFLALLTTAAACDRCPPDIKRAGADTQVRALVVEVSKNQARVVSSKVVTGRLPPPPTGTETPVPNRLQDLHLEFEVQSSAVTFYIGRTVVALRPIVEGSIQGRPMAVDTRVVIIAVPTKPADSIVFYRLDPSGRGRGGGSRVRIGESRLTEGIK